MKFCLVMTDPRAFWLAFKHRVWGTSSECLQDVESGDRLVFLLDDRVIGGIAQVQGQPFCEEVPIWRDDVRPYRVRIRFLRAYLPENQPPLLGRIHELVRAAWGRHYPLAAAHLEPGEPRACQALMRVLSRYRNDLSEVREQIDALLASAPDSRACDAPRLLSPSTETTPEPVPPTHQHIQRILRDLGLAGGFQVWIAVNDMNRVVDGERLGDGCLRMLPEMGLNIAAHRLVEHIDVLWLHHHQPRCAFEVELSTGIYPGILRMADLFMTVPHLDMPVYIVAPSARFSVFKDQIRRPMFRHAGLEQRCRFVPLEKLMSLDPKSSKHPMELLEYLSWASSS